MNTVSFKLTTTLIGLTLALLASAALANDPASAQLRLEVAIPDRSVLMFASDPGPVTASETLQQVQQEGLVFDLSCATLGTLPNHCLTLYGGPLLDTFGRPYPPVNRDVDGRFISTGAFPQYFESSTKTLRFFHPRSQWNLQVQLLGMPELDPSHFAIWTDQGQWRCLGWHEDWLEESGRGWMEATSCPPSANAALESVSVAESTTYPDGWQEIDVRLMLRIDGSEHSGSHSGVLRYTLVSF